MSIMTRSRVSRPFSWDFLASLWADIVCYVITKEFWRISPAITLESSTKLEGLDHFHQNELVCADIAGSGNVQFIFLSRILIDYLFLLRIYSFFHIFTAGVFSESPLFSTKQIEILELCGSVSTKCVRTFPTQNLI